jgi:hypothetical protein
VDLKLAHGIAEGASSKSDRVSLAIRRLLQDVLSHLRFRGFRFGAVRQSDPNFIKDVSEDNQGSGS